MTQKNMYKRTFKKAYIWTVLILYFILSGIFPCAALASDLEESRKKATEKLLGTMESASVEEVTQLIQEGADINLIVRGVTAWLLAAQKNSSPDVIRVLIENGANVNIAFNTFFDSGVTILMFAAQSSSNPEVLRVMIENGADVNASTKDYGSTPLIEASIYNSNPDVLQILIENGADVDAVDNNGRTPLMHAAWHNPNPDVLHILIENRADVNAADNNERTPLMYATQRDMRRSAQRVSTPDVLRVLIESGANVDAVDNAGKSALMLAIESSPIPNILQVLIDSGADVDIMDLEGKRALDYAEGSRHLKKPLSYNLSGTRIAEDISLDWYHPWSGRPNQISRLNSPAAFRISGDYPRIDGATSAYPIYAAVINEVYAVDNKTELQQYLFCSRTESAYNRLVQGEVDMIFVLQPSDEQLQSAKDAGVELHFTPIAKDAFVFFINSKNPVSGLSIEQIKDIYLKKITNWQEVGGNDREILPYQRPANSGSQTAMLKEVMKGEELPPPLQEELRMMMSGIVLHVATYQDKEESIGYSFRFFVEKMMRDVLLEKNKELDYFQLKLDLIPKNDPALLKEREKYQSEIQRVQDVLNPVKLLSIDGIAPSEENIRNGTYPFTVNVYAVTAGTKNPHVQDLIDWMLSPQGQELVEKTGYVGVVTDKN